MGRVQRALISVADKTGIVDFCRGLAQLAVEIYSTGGTSKALEHAKVPVRPISDLTNFPEILDGRVKTLHPAVHAGILARRTRRADLESLSSLSLRTIDLVAVNLYRFEDAARRGAAEDDLLEEIDIGGPALLRAAAKNHRDVIVAYDPSTYPGILEHLRKFGDLTPDGRRRLALGAFMRTGAYDAAIAGELHRRFEPTVLFPEIWLQAYDKVQDLRYGENAHQQAAYYRAPGLATTGLPGARQVHGKVLSYNNILDINDAALMVHGFDRPAAVVLKHTNPCGAAVAATPLEAYTLAFDTDPKSAFGGVVGLNRAVEKDVAEAISARFLEAVVAPGFRENALDLLQRKKNIRLVELPRDLIPSGPREYDVRTVLGGLLVQTPDRHAMDAGQLTSVSKRPPTGDETRDLLFAWAIARLVKSNAIVLALRECTTGIGAGQMSRVDAVDIAVRKSEGKSKGSVMASDAFFPFPDAVEAAGKAGITAIIHPGGSIKDKEVVATADSFGMAMVTTGVRAFRH